MRILEYRTRVRHGGRWETVPPNRNEKVAALLERQFPDHEAILWAVAGADEQHGSDARFTEHWLNTAAEPISLEGVWIPSDVSEGPNGETKLSQADGGRLKHMLEPLLKEEKRLESLTSSKLDNLYEHLLDQGRFFSKESARPDYAYWRGRKVWSADETVALSLDREPQRVNDRSLRQFKKSPFAIEYRRRLAEANRAIELGELGKGISRSDLRLLFTRMGIDIPAGFVIHRLATVEDDIADERMRESTKRVLETLILVMAAEKYGYDPSADDQAQVFQAIFDDAKANGLSLAEKSVPNKLNAAWQRFVSRKDLDGKLQEIKKRYDEKAMRRLKKRK
ncbi:hypothetical protein P9272_19815 [Mesorhizobium sp. WSM4976]|uniref:hypothetical protein n=1 Tax=Mesorhizobium sp. WSM4976 TaxID=3038549 RepID=UPI002415B33A|nr:hypothetical protein [Mesorhizobium sp. WSM4976]MDG4895820.1 hypothetical protein [Mesorhizobium sp. WSM4976]